MQRATISDSYRAYQRAYRAKNRERLKEKARKYYEKNAERRKKYAVEYYFRNKDRISQRRMIRKDASNYIYDLIRSVT